MARGPGVTRVRRRGSSFGMATIEVEGRKVNIPAFEVVTVGEEVAIREKMPPECHACSKRASGGRAKRGAVARTGPRSSFKAKVVALPKREDVQTPPIKEQLIVELYSK